MTELAIVRMGHPVLMRPADPVTDPTAPEVARLIDDMRDALTASGGVGLAAPQVAAGLRVVLYSVPEGRGAPVPLTALVNPTLDPLGEERVVDWEACLSLPGLTGAVPRWRRVRLTATLPDGTALEREAEDFHARVLQHEIDHLDGIVYPMRMDDLSTFGFVDEIKARFAEGA